MRERTYIFLIFILLLAIVTAWMDLADPHIQLGPFDKQIRVHQGLDLQGGLRVLLQADLPEGTQVTPESLGVVKGIIENRVNALGVTEPVIQTQGTNRIVVEVPGISNSDEAIRTFGNTGLLEFIDAGANSIPIGETVSTTGPTGDNSCSSIAVAVPAGTAAATTSPTVAPTAVISATPNLTGTNPLTTTPPIGPTQVYTTVMTGDCLASAAVQFQNTNVPIIGFALKEKGGQIFGAYTTANVRRYLAIALDKKVISSPVINSPITTGSGIIEGRFTLKEATDLAIQLKYGSLPVPMKVVDTTTIGPTLGQDSVQKSIVAGIVGMSVVALFMLLYYRLPGLLADLALAVYVLLTFAIYKGGVPGVIEFVTLTLPGIAGLVLSVGVAVDANILIFERMKEELRAGRSLPLAIENGFARAWPSIRDSNISTLITCAILLWFGTSFGASLVAGFALTLGLGVLTSLFTAVLVTRTFLRLTLDIGVTRNLWWYGVSRPSEPL